MSKRITRKKSASIAVATVETTIVPTIPGMLPALTLADFGVIVGDDYRMPAYVDAFVAGFRAIAPTPSITRDERAACSERFAAVCAAMMPHAAMPVGRHTGRFSTSPVFESQNTLYVAAAFANVMLTNGHFMAAWRAELPNAKCDYLAKNYAFTTLSEYINGRHNGSAVHCGADVVGLWNAGHRLPRPSSAR